MPKIDRRELFNITIREPDGLSALLEQVFPRDEGALVPQPTFRSDLNTPPLFLYTESRRDDNWLDSFSYYGGNGQSAQIGFGAREVLKLDSRIIRDGERGRILNAFCRIEFCLDVLVCVHEGVFEGKMTWNQLKEEFAEQGARYATTEQKIEALKKSKLIRSKTRDLLEKAKKIRNVLAHQYMPEAGLGLTKTDVDRYSSLAEAIELIFGAAWVELLKDYVPKQLIIVEWLRTGNGSV